MALAGRDGQAKDRTPRGASGRPRLFALTILVLLAGLCGLWMVVDRNGGSISLDAAPSSRLLSQLSRDAGLSASAAGPVARIPVDGTTPDTADRDFQVADGSAARLALLRACAGRGLGTPGVDEQRMMPQAVCTGRWEGRDATVLLFPARCTGACRVSIEIRVI